jgi:hyperosmotically inducible periplasmic protein
MQFKSKKIVFATGLAGVVALAGLTGCQSDTGGARSAGRRSDDKQITKDVKSDLSHAPVYKFDGVHVTTYDGIVQLSGFVDTMDQKTEAGRIASSLEGVREVVNSITLKPAPPSPVGSPTGRYQTDSAQKPAEQPK